MFHEHAVEVVPPINQTPWYCWAGGIIHVWALSPQHRHNELSAEYFQLQHTLSEKPRVADTRRLDGCPKLLKNNTLAVFKSVIIRKIQTSYSNRSI